MQYNFNKLKEKQNTPMSKRHNNVHVSRREAKIAIFFLIMTYIRVKRLLKLEKKFRAGLDFVLR